MQQFMGPDFLLNSPSAVRLYHDHAKHMPIIDYHCHINPKEIYEDRHFENLFQVWLSGDHYKWRVMRSNGVPEESITGTEISEREKFQRFAEALPRAIGNPMYHWCHLELQRYFGYTGVLNGQTAQEVWDLTEHMLQNEDMGVRGLIKKSNVAFIGTTDDPVDDLIWHQKLRDDTTFDTIVAPSFRPDKAVNIDKPGFAAYIQSLGEVTNCSIGSLAQLKQALVSRIDYFHQNGCKISDHGLDCAVFAIASEEEVDQILITALSGGEVSAADAEKYKTNMLLFFAREYAKRNWAMQIHYNCIRNPNSVMFDQLGPDTGFDHIGPDNGISKLSRFLNELNKIDQLPKTIIYSLDGSDNSAIATMIGAFQGPGVRGKVQHGSAWWFNDNKTGMIEQMTNLANLSILGNFIGMLTDSRSFLSYTRHEYFRRILCNLIGGWIENGEYPADYDFVGSLVEDICCKNAINYFDLEVKA